MKKLLVVSSLGLSFACAFAASPPSFPYQFTVSTGIKGQVIEKMTVGINGDTEITPCSANQKTLCYVDNGNDANRLVKNVGDVTATDPINIYIESNASGNPVWSPALTLFINNSNGTNGSKDYPYFLTPLLSSADCNSYFSQPYNSKQSPPSPARVIISCHSEH